MYPVNIHTNRMLALEAAVDMGIDALERGNALLQDGVPSDPDEFERLEGLRADSAQLAKRYSYASQGV